MDAPIAVIPLGLPAQGEAMGKAAKKETPKRVPFNWAKLLAMWKAGKSYTEMAKALDSHYNPEGDDPTKSIRAKCSVAMSKGVKINGKETRFARRDKARKEHAPKKATSKKATKSTTNGAKPKTTPKPSVVVPKPEEPKPQREA